jgi:hypothetical protein
MANEITLTQLAGSIPDVVRAVALKARYDEAVAVKKVMNCDKDVAKFGDRVSLSILPKFSVNNVGSGGSVQRQQLSLTAVEVTVNAWKECTVDVEDKGEVQSALSVLKEYSSQFGEALSEVQDTDLLGEYANLTTYSVGDGTTPMDDAMVRLARLKLDKNSSGGTGTGKVPKKDRVWLLSPDAEADLIGLARFSEAQNTGFARGLQVENGRISKLYGDDVFVTDQVATSSGIRMNLYVQREALAIATQRNFKVVPLAKVQLSEALASHILYGVKTVRADHGVVVKSAVNADA